MKENTSLEWLEERIEQLVCQHIAAAQAAAAAAVARAFAGSVKRAATPPTAQKAGISARRPSRRRRTAQEVAQLAERLCAAVHATPGETMATLAGQVGATPRELHVAVKQLRRANRVRATGQRQHTRYFPATPKPGS